MNLLNDATNCSVDGRGFFSRSCNGGFPPCGACLACGRELRRFLAVRGLAGAQDMGAITAFRSPWPICPSFSLPLSPRIESVDQAGVHHFFWFGRDHLRISLLQPNHGLLKNYADPTQWWDNRSDKVGPLEKWKWIQYSDQQVTGIFPACTRNWALAGIS